MPEIAFGKTCVVQDDFGLLAPLFQFKFDERIDAGLPVGGTPGLNDPLSGNQLNVSPHDQATEERKGATRFAIDPGGRTCEGGKLFGIQQGVVNALTARLNIDLLMEIGEQSFDSRALRFLYFFLIGPSLPPKEDR